MNGRTSPRLRALARRLPPPLRQAARAAARSPRRVREERIRRQFVSAYLGDRALLAQFEREIEASGLLAHLGEKRRQYRRAVPGTGDGAGPGYTIGAIAHLEAVHLYAIMRKVRPRLAVETGVANGFSTAFSLLALRENGGGELYSIDLPRVVGREYEPGTFHEGERRAGIPEGREPGWLVPDDLRDRWTLVLGRSQDVLPPLLERLGTIDAFMHDSEHTFECMWFEYTHAWPALRDGGVLISHDVNATPAFARFAQEQDRAPIRAGKGMAFLVK